jgi:hypothetical protein
MRRDCRWPEHGLLQRRGGVLCMRCDGLRMAGARLHLQGRRGRVKTAWLRVALSAHKDAAGGAVKRPGMRSLTMRLVNALGKCDPTTDAATATRMGGRTRSSATRTARACNGGEDGFRSAAAAGDNGCGDAHMAVGAHAAWSHAARPAPQDGAAVSNRRMCPGQALNQPRWQQAGCRRLARGLEKTSPPCRAAKLA